MGPEPVTFSVVLGTDDAKALIEYTLRTGEAASEVLRTALRKHLGGKTVRTSREK